MLNMDENNALIASALENMAEPDALGGFLTKFGENTNELYGKLAQMEAENDTLKSTNKTLAKLNASLYLKQGVQESRTDEDNTNPNNKPISIKDLFNERGFID